MKDRIENVKKNIDTMNKLQHIEILKILKKNNIKINENKNGVFINLSFLTIEALTEIEEYLVYIHDQEKTLEPLEIQKNELKSLLVETEEN